MELTANLSDARDTQRAREGEGGKIAGRMGRGAVVFRGLRARSSARGGVIIGSTGRGRVCARDGGRAGKRGARTELFYLSPTERLRSSGRRARCQPARLLHVKIHTGNHRRKTGGLAVNKYS
ncbi:hypothetical protein NDU88_000686 [Pleurodeles waltl]|uniref:Uncharacterized protein n=1 Tax=Pleurodeles waltl TaxID=8319 RepID=A0AAV7WKE4_PLEWA|nr:hypothetical protein NDU88_000686 [Pleurodeles waltl]